MRYTVTMSVCRGWTARWSRYSSAGLCLSLRALVLSLLFAFFSVVGAQVFPEDEAFPLRPPDTSSPRDTLTVFLDNMEIARQGFIDDDLTLTRAARYRAIAALDFSQTVDGREWDEQSLRAMYLKEILDRIALLPVEEIPGDADVRETGISSWTVPNTQIEIRRVEIGARAGQFLFSAPTVASLHRDYRRVRHLPYESGVTRGILELFNEQFDSLDFIAGRVRAELKPVDADSPRTVLVEFLRSVNEAHDIVMAADSQAASLADYRDADRRANRLVGRSIRMLDLSQVPVALREDVGKEAVLKLKEVLDRTPLPTLSSVPSELSLAESDRPFVRWTYPNTEIEIVPLPDAPGQFGFSAATVDRAGEFYEQVRHLPYRGEGGGPYETRFEEEYPDATASPGFYEYYIRTPGSLVPEASWLGRLVDGLPSGLSALVLGQTIWQWLTMLITLLLLAALVTTIYLVAIAQGRRVNSALAQWLRLLAPLAGAYLVSQTMVFLDATVNLTGRVNATQLVAGTALIYLFIAFAVFRVTVAMAETLARWLRRRSNGAESDEPEPGDSRFDTSLMRVGATALGVVAAIVVFVSGVRQLGIDVLPLLAGLGVGGLAVALAVRPTLENMIGGVILYADRPVHVGDYCMFGQQGGVVERIGLRSTRIRAKNRTLITVPNSVFADMQITNFANCDKMLIETVIGLRYETTPEQLRHVLARMRRVCFGHPKIENDTLRVRFGAFGPSSLDVNVRVYALVQDWNEYHAIREDLYFRFMDLIEESGTGVAFPSTTVYMARDDGLDPEKTARAESEVEGWREAGELPFPRTPEPLARRIVDKIDWPPRGSPEAREAVDSPRDETRGESADESSGEDRR